MYHTAYLFRQQEGETHILFLRFARCLLLFPFPPPKGKELKNARRAICSISSPSSSPLEVIDFVCKRRSASLKLGFSPVPENHTLFISSIYKSGVSILIPPDFEHLACSLGTLGTNALRRDGVGCQGTRQAPWIRQDRALYKCWFVGLLT